MMADEKKNEEKAAAASGPAWKGSLSADKPIIAPDGHVVLSQEDIDARKAREADGA